MIDLPSQREKDMFKTSLFKTSQSKTLEIVKKMFSDLKVKIEGTSRSTVCTISRNEKEIVSDENIDCDTVSFVFAKKIFDDDLPEIKRFVGNSKPMSFTKKIGIQNLLLLICNLKKDLFKPSFLFLLIKFMNGILIV